MPQTPGLFARADDRNALATTAGGAIQSQRTRRPARSIGLVSPATVNGAPLSETKVKADLAARFSNPQRSQFIPEPSETYTVSPSATN